MGGRKQNTEYFRRTLTRDRELEETFYHEYSIENLKNKIMQKFDQHVGWFITGVIDGRAQGDFAKQEAEVEEKYIEGI